MKILPTSNLNRLRPGSGTFSLWLLPDPHVQARPRKSREVKVPLAVWVILFAFALYFVIWLGLELLNWAIAP
jgi:antibiotic biosynthesis monooxygenase (ABM) superfamily enzyme